jgi:hypothetical protein
VKRPWLTTPKGQRTAMWLGTLLAFLSLIPLTLQLQHEQQRQVVSQLQDRISGSCDLSDCPPIEILAGLKVTEVEITEGENINFVTVHFSNPGRLAGERELRIEVRNQDGVWLEGAKSWVKLQDKNPVSVQFGLTTDVADLKAAKLLLGY